MKIKIKIEKPQLDSIIQVLQKERQPAVVNSLVEKSEMYSYASAFQKLLKKQIEKALAFDSKPFVITFCFAEAYALWKYLKLSTTTDVYRANCCEIVRNQLHPQLV
ncbi:MAG: hypothetical protein PSN34_06430 [Urechidicola sp.]|nr:hypothetical protein [Urechidicola sp.]